MYILIIFGDQIIYIPTKRNVEIWISIKRQVTNEDI